MGIIRVADAPFQSLWRHLLPDKLFDPQVIAQQCKTDGGYDFEGAGLSTSDIEKLFTVEGYCSDVRGLAFFASEVLAYYHALAPELTPIQLVSFALNASLVRCLAKAGHLDWAMKIEDVLHV